MLLSGSRLIAVAALAVAMVGASPAAAQNDPIGGFFKFMFGNQQRQQQAPQPVVIDPNRNGQTVKPKRTEPVEPKVTEVPKNADAQTVLVIGDEQAAGLAVGLQIAFADSPSIQVISKARENSGLVRDQSFDWSARLAGFLGERKTDFIVVMLGQNDRVTFPASATGGKSEEVRSEKWEVLYRERVKKLNQVLKDSGKPFFWVGLPPMERPSQSAFASYLNGIFKPAAEQAGGISIDSWNGFVDEEGHFTYLGPDIDGQQKRLRSYDGTLFTRAGQRKLAYYVETEIRKLMHGDIQKPEASLPETPTVQPKGQEAMLAAPPPLPPAPWGKVGPVIQMNTGSDSDTELAGAPQSRTVPKPPVVAMTETLPGGYPLTETPLYRRLFQGEPIAAPSGRVDDFSRKR